MAAGAGVGPGAAEKKVAFSVYGAVPAATHKHRRSGAGVGYVPLSAAGAQRLELADPGCFGAERGGFECGVVGVVLLRFCLRTLAAPGPGPYDGQAGQGSRDCGSRLPMGRLPELARACRVHWGRGA